MPPHRLGGGIYYRDANWLARVNLLHAFAQDEFAAFDTPTPGYNLLNAELSYTIKLDGSRPACPEMTIGLRGENLLDDDIRNSVSFKKDEVLQPGAQRPPVRHHQAQLSGRSPHRSAAIGTQSPTWPAAQARPVDFGTAQ